MDRIVIKFCYPRLDIAVTRSLNHLLKVTLSIIIIITIIITTTTIIIIITIITIRIIFFIIFIALSQSLCLIPTMLGMIHMFVYNLFSEGI